jgi:hypothetical protein
MSFVKDNVELKGQSNGQSEDASADRLVIGALPWDSMLGSGIKGVHTDRHGRMQRSDVQ